jgi:CubicO group peptidase (beta-lactamase class C family)
MLGYIIEKVEKKPYERVVRERILQPLGMTRSGFDFTNLKDPRRSTGYFTSSESGKAPVVDSTIAYSAGALYSTAEDLYKWHQAIQAGKLLSRKGWERTFTPVMNKYGFGWAVDTFYRKGVQMHSGGIHGFTSFILRVPEDDIAIILLDNTSRNVGVLARSILAILYDQPYPKPGLKNTGSASSEARKEILGEYRFTPLFTIRIFEKEGKLMAQASQQDAYEIVPEKTDLYTYKELEAKIQIGRGDDGKVSGITLLQNGYRQNAKKIN